MTIADAPVAGVRIADLDATTAGATSVAPAWREGGYAVRAWLPKFCDLM